MRVSKPLLAAAVLLVSSLAMAPSGTAQDLGPDFIVSNVDCMGGISCSEQAPEDAVHFSVDVENDGDSDATDVDVTFTIEDRNGSRTVYEEIVTVDDLDQGENKSIQTQANVSAWTAEAGQFELSASVPSGSEGDLAEPTDNSDSHDFDLGPDLQVGEIHVVPNNPVEGEEVKLSADVTNDGPIDVSDRFDVEFNITGTDDNFDPRVDSLAAGETKNVSIDTTWEATGDEHTLNVSADPAPSSKRGEIFESDDTNNNNSRSIDVQDAVPDLVATNVSTTPQTFSPQTAVNLKATVKNVGTATVDTDFDIRFEIDGEPFGEDPEITTTLAPGEKENVTTDNTRTFTADSYELRATADHGGGGQGDIDEGDNEGNNDLSNIVHVGRELVVDDLSTQPPTPHIDQNTTVVANVTNQGTQSSSKEITVQIEAEDDFSRNVTVQGMNALSTRSIEVGPWQPSSPSNEAKPITAEVDTKGNVTEIDEENNTAEELVEVDDPLADLVVTDIAYPDGLDADGDATVEATIQNQGDSEVSGEIVTNELYINGEFEDRFEEDTREGTIDDEGGWDVDEERTSTFTWSDVVRGNYTVRVAADAYGNATELSEKNNRSETQLVGPDAELKDIRWTPSTPEEDEATTFTAVVANPGNQELSEADVNLSVDGEHIGTKTVQTIDPDSNDTVDFTWTATEGEHTVVAEADPFDNVTEALEDNNDRSESLSTTSSADLVVTSIQFGSSLAEGDSVRFSATVKNEGESGVEGNFDVEFRIDGSPLSTSTVNALEPGQSTTLTSKSWTAEEGEHTITVEADVQDTVGESDEGNNDRFRSFQVDASENQQTKTGPPNLVVTSISPPDEATEGDEVRFLATVENRGGEVASGSTLALTVNGEEISQASVNRLDPGQSASVTSANWVAETGEHKIRAIADVDDDVSEANENDNRRSITLTVYEADDEPSEEALVDLFASEVGLEGEPSAGDEATITATVGNAEGDTVDRALVEIVVDGTRVGTANATDLAAGDSQTVTVAWEASEGEHTLEAEVDPNDEIDEADEKNNLAEAQVTVEGSSGIPSPGVAALVAALGAAAVSRRRS